MDSLTFYCSVNFLSALYKYVDRPMSDWLNDDGNDEVRKLYKLLHRHAEVITDESIIDFISESSPNYNPHFKKLIKTGGNIPLFSKERFLKIRSADENLFNTDISIASLFFLDEDIKFAERLENDYGVIVYTADELENTGFLFNHNVEEFKRGRKVQWDFLTSYKHPFNSMVISDAYLLNKESSVQNLKELLVNFLPSKLKIEFHLTIISDRDSKSGLPRDIEKLRNDLSDFLASHFDYPINITIVLAKIHDRNLITNYFWCSSGYGFELIRDSRSQRDTHITLTPRTYLMPQQKGYKSRAGLFDNENSNPSFWNSLAEQFKRSLKDTPEKLGLLVNISGDRVNRLLK